MQYSSTINETQQSGVLSKSLSATVQIVRDAAALFTECASTSQLNHCSSNDSLFIVITAIL